MDAHGGDVFDLRHAERGGRVGEVRANAVVGPKSIVGEDGIIVLGDEARERQVVANAHGLVRRVDEVRGAGRVGHELPGFLHVGHHVAVDDGVGVRGERIGSGEHGFPAVGHAVAVCIPEGGVRVGLARFVVGRDAVAVNVGRVGTGRRRGGVGEDGLVVKAVGHAVLVDVRILHEELHGRHGAALGHDLHLDGRVEVHHADADLVGVAPAFAALADAVAVAVDVGNGVVGAFLKAEEADAVAGLDEVRDRAVNLFEARLRGGLAGEVGRLEELHHHVGEVVRGGAEVAHLDVRRAVCGSAGTALREAVRERGHVAPHGRFEVRVGELGREHRNAPVVVGVVAERPGVGARVRAHVHGRGPGVRASRVARRQGLERGSVNGRIVRIEDLEDEGRVVLGAGPLERRTLRFHPRARQRARRDGGRLALFGRERNREGVQHVRRVDVHHRSAALHDGVGDGEDVLRIEAARRLHVGAQVGPVEAEPSGGDEVALVDRRAVGRGHVAVIDDAALDGRAGFQRLLAVDGGADDADHVGIDGVGEALAGGSGFVSHLDDELGHVVPAHVNVLHEAVRLDAGRERAVAVKVDERLEGGRSLNEGAGRGLAERERELLVLHRGQLDVVPDAVEAVLRGDGRRIEVLAAELGEVEGEVARGEVDLANALHVDEHVALLGCVGHIDGDDVP